MSFKERFNSAEPIGSPICFNGPPWCGKCKPEHCLYLMEYAFIPEEIDFINKGETNGFLEMSKTNK